MRDVFWTILAIWVIWKIYSAFKGSKTFVFQKHDHFHGEQNTHQSKDFTEQNSKKKVDDDEFTPYEEIK